MTILRAALAMACVLFGLAWVAHGELPPHQPLGEAGDVAMAAEDPERVAPVLRQLAELDVAGAAWQDVAQRRGIQFDDAGRVLVSVDGNARLPLYHDGRRIRDDPPVPRQLKDDLVAAFAGAELVPTSSRTRFRVWIAPRSVPELVAWLAPRRPDAVVIPVAPPVHAYYGNVHSEGPSAMNASNLWNSGFRGSGVKVAMLDTGYQGVTSTFAAEIGPFEYHPSQTNLNADAGIHGTASAEILRDVAPEVDLLLLREDQSLDVETAVQYAIDQGADIISRSLLSWEASPENGASCDAARNAINNGVKFFNSAGNTGNRYWEAASPSISGINFVRFSGMSEVNQIFLNGQSHFAFTFAYDYPDTSYARFRVSLWEYDGATMFPRAQGQNHWDQWIYYTPTSSNPHYISIERIATGTVGRMRLVVFDNNINFTSPYGSVVNPATVPNVHGIGAVRSWEYDSNAWPEDYSARGGGLWNLPLYAMAPTWCSTASYGALGYGGTSCACPHAAGLFALDMSAGTNGSSIGTVDLGSSGWNADTGHGLLMGTTPAVTQAPDPLTLNSIDESGISLSWRNIPATTRYRLERRTGASGSWGLRYLGPNTSHLDATGISPGTTYQYRVRGENESVGGPHSVTLEVVTAPPAPNGLASTEVTTTSATLSWNTAPGATAYELQRAIQGSGQWAAVYNGGDTTVDENNLSPETSYDYRVQAFNATGASPFSSTIVVTTEAPASADDADSGCGATKENGAATLALFALLLMALGLRRRGLAVNNGANAPRPSSLVASRRAR